MRSLSKATAVMALGCALPGLGTAQTLLVSDTQAGAIDSVLAGGSAQTLLSGLGQPGQLSAGPGGTFLAADNLAREIEQFGASGGPVTAYAAASNYFSAVTYDPSNGEVYVGVAGDAYGGSVYAISAAGAVSLLAVSVGHVTALTSDGAGMLYGASSSRVFSVSERSGAVGTVGSYAGVTGGIAYQGGDLFVAETGAPGLLKLSLDGTILQSWDDGDLNQVAVDANGDVFGTQSATGSVLEFRGSGAVSTVATVNGPGTSLDGIVVVSAVPEPPGWSFALGTGALALGVLARRRSPAL
jgi:hypothetical protein